MKSTNQIWIVTPYDYQYGISTLFSQTSFCVETCGDVAKCWLFSLIKSFTTLESRRKLVSVSFCKDFCYCYWGCTSQLLATFSSLSPVTVPEVFARVNSLFYRYGGHIELIQFKEYYRMPRGHEHILFVFSSTFRDIFS